MKEDALKKSIDLCTHLPPLMGIEAHVLDMEDCSRFCGEEARSSFCEKCTFRQKDEMKPHVYGLYEAYRWQGKYMYYCPVGLMFGAFALLDEKSGLAGGLIAGPMVVGDVADTLLDSPCPELEPEIRRLKNLDPDEAAHLFEGLAIVAEGLSASVWSRAGTADSFDQQSYLNTIYEVSGKLGRTGMVTRHVELEDKLIEDIMRGRKSEAQDVLNEILGSIYYSCGFDMDGIQVRVLELLATISRAAMKAGADIGAIFGFSTSFIRKIEEFDNIDDISVWLSGIVHRFVDAVFDYRQMKHSDTVYRVMEYIRANYNTKLNLDELARHVCFSRSYLSSVFKKETGMSISSYTNRVRVENSKRMLKDSSMSLAYIAHECCFEDQSYFTKVFKSCTGMSPKRYRDTNIGKAVE